MKLLASYSPDVAAWLRLSCDEFQAIASLTNNRRALQIGYQSALNTIEGQHIAGDNGCCPVLCLCACLGRARRQFANVEMHACKMKRFFQSHSSSSHSSESSSSSSPARAARRARIAATLRPPSVMGCSAFLGASETMTFFNALPR